MFGKEKIGSLQEKKKRKIRGGGLNMKRCLILFIIKRLLRKLQRDVIVYGLDGRDLGGW